MKTNNSNQRPAFAGLPPGRRVTNGKTDTAGAERSCHASRVTLAAPSEAKAVTSAFTLLELLVVIAIIVVIAALLLPVGSIVKQRAIIHAAQAQMAQLETAIDRYKAAYGFYPPGNANTGPFTNQLYYELSGHDQHCPPSVMPFIKPWTTAPKLIPTMPAAAFGVSGFINCTKPGSDEVFMRAQDFLPDLRPNQIGTVSYQWRRSGEQSSLPPSAGRTRAIKPLGQPDINPWRYNSARHQQSQLVRFVVQLVISGQTNLICNWSKSVHPQHARCLDFKICSPMTPTAPIAGNVP